MARITRLDVQGFRGIRQPAVLLFDGKSILLFGENGSGKSSFVDALERLLVGRVSTLDGRGSGLSSDRHGPHIRPEGYPTRISATFDDRANSVLSLGTDPATLQRDVRRYLEAARENVPILRRRQILDFIESQPRERYDLLRPFIRIEAFEKWEETLKQVRAKIDGDWQTAQRNELRLRQELARHVGATDVGENALIAYVNRELASLGHSVVATVHEVPLALERLSESLRAYGDVSRQEQLSTALAAFDAVLEESSSLAVDRLTAAASALRARELHEAHLFYETVLVEGARWIGEGRLQKCPLCEQPIDPAGVVARAEERLAAMKELVAQRRLVAKEHETLKAHATRIQDSVRRARRAASALPDEDRTAVSSALAEMTTSIEALLSALDLERGQLDVGAVQTSAGRATHALAPITATRAQLQRQLQAAAAPSQAHSILLALERIKSSRETWNALQTATAQASGAGRRAYVAQRLVESAETSRKEEVQTLFDKLSGEIDRLYIRFHEAESHGNVRLEVREAVQRSVNIRADFYEREAEDPRAYYSESHLDTLGISIFLTLRNWYRQQQPACDLLVLDDVLTSVDVAHAVRVAEVLLSDFAEFQILLTTHDRIWFEHLRDIQSRCGVAQGFINKVIHKWTIEEGPDLREPEDERQAIDRLISEGSSREIAVMSGRLLEHILQELRYSLGLRVRAKRGERYEIGELWPVFYATVKQDYPTFFGKGRRPLEALDVRWPVRNWIGAHWNPWAMNVSRDTAIEFAKAVRELFDLVFCSECRRFISPSVTPIGQLACRCGRRIYSAAGKEPVQPRTREELIQSTKGAFRESRLDTAKYFEAKRVERQRES